MDDFEYEPLANLMRGLTEDEPEIRGDALRTSLKERGLDSDEVATEIESRISAHLQRRRTLRPAATARKWNHPSVKMFAEGSDAVQKMISLARHLALKVLETTSNSSAIDPFALAESKHIPVVANETIADARLVPLPGDRCRIEFNPHQPKSRTRFSIAHELAHTFFVDWRDAIRNRESRGNFNRHEWELEMLCNIGAAELLMPISSFPELRSEALDIRHLMKLKDSLEVSAEALLARVARLTNEPCAMFAASRVEQGELAGRYKIDYAIPSRSWGQTQHITGLLPPKTSLADCMVIGFTAFGDETWDAIGHLHVQGVGVAPYRGTRFPRVLGLVRSSEDTGRRSVRIAYVTGDATRLRGTGPRILAHVINDKAISWGFGFARAVASKWPKAEKAFRQHIFSDKSAMRLGNTFNTEVEPELWTFQMIAQHGYGPRSTTRIRYSAIESCLEELARFAQQQHANVHMPRVGTGYGGGKWEVVADLIDEIVCAAGVSVTVYELPGARPEQSGEEPDLFSQRRK
jgi:Zn-dependent peptidase ImmA (M78 family)/O-acetyl-ADP-ribose deacetylase (regulator of RNase III)